MDNIKLSFLLTFIAGFSTMIGTIPIFLKVNNINKFICASLSFASGVMFSVSVIDLIPESLSLINTKYTFFLTIIICLISMITGIIFSGVIDYYLPTENNYQDKKLYKTGLIMALAIVLHNIPEGIATFITGNSNTNLAINLTIAIALHNIPEGISIAIPIYYSTKKKKKAILYTLISALSEPFGAFIAYVFLKNYVTDIFLGILFSLIAGIMLNISLCELLPEAREYKYNKVTVISFIIGIIFMLFSLIL